MVSQSKMKKTSILWLCFLIIQDINLRFHRHQVIKMPVDRFTDNLENTFFKKERNRFVLFCVRK